MTSLKCTCGKPITVDDDFPFRLLTVNWSCMNDGGAIKGHRPGTKDFIQLDQQIYKAELGETIDHIDRNYHNNLRSNLRSATLQEQNWNRGVSKRSVTGFKGVCYEKNSASNPYKAVIYKDGKSHHLGCFPTAKEAAQRYNKAAKEMFGAFAYLNPV